MKKIIPVVFVGLFLLNSFGYYFIFSFNQDILQNEMKRLIRAGYFKDQYEKLVITNPSTNPSFKWIDKGEFRYAGKLYDLISMEIQGTSIILNCINDKKEEQLAARHDEFQDILVNMTFPGKMKNTRAMQNMLIQNALIRNFFLQLPTNSFPLIFYDPVSVLNSIPLSPSHPPPQTT